MSLATYQRKRKFQQTPEPSGKQGAKGAKTKSKPSKALHFVIQKHTASHLHYDFRLELDGVLVSWAVPKGPSLNPKNKRLAMKVEDHPLDYRHFEGVIPEGNYGAGTVMVWDEGIYYVDADESVAENEKRIRQGLGKGELKFILEGQKLKGSFVLVHTGRDEEDNRWLLMKHKDEFADSHEILLQDASVLTHRKMDEIAGKKPEKSSKSTRGTAKTTPAKKTLSLPSEAVKAKMPHSIKPMLSTLVDEAFDKDGWFFELKLDGYRAVAEIQRGDVTLYSRNFLPFEEKFKSVYQALVNFAESQNSCILDGEIVALDNDGKPRFQRLQDTENNQDRLVYYVFDLLYYNGYDLQALPLYQRKELLRQLLPADGETGYIRYCRHIETRGRDFFEAAQAQGVEGIMAKDAQSPYLPGKRTGKWLKLKAKKHQEAIICGYTQPRGGRKNFGALVLGVYDRKKLQYIGHAGTGMTEKMLKDIYQQLQPLVTDDCPFETRPKTNEKATWVKPERVCEIYFAEWTQDGQARHPVFMGMRPDKSAKEVVREIEQDTDQEIAEVSPSAKKFAKETPHKKMAKTQTKEEAPAPRKKFGSIAPGGKDLIIHIGNHRVSISNPQKVLWPGLDYTKKEMVDYYQAMADFILPYLNDRPFVLHRFPDGIEGESFYQKDMNQNLPTWAETLKVESESSPEGRINYVLCQNTETLLYLANLGCIEMNPWNSRKQELEKPDWMAIDLDPGDENTFEEVIQAAQVIHDILDNFKAPHYCKTSGASGLHVYVPVEAKYGYEVVKNFAQMVATLAQKELPKITTLERSLSRRSKDHIYLDCLQNRYGQTLVAPYSLRPIPEATVSAPLHWEEVKKGLKPQQFTMGNMEKRVEREGDLWKPVIGKGVDLQKLVESGK